MLHILNGKVDVNESGESALLSSKHQITKQLRLMDVWNFRYIVLQLKLFLNPQSQEQGSRNADMLAKAFLDCFQTKKPVSVTPTKYLLSLFAN